MELRHKSEAEVAKLMALPFNSKMHREGYLFLARAGDFYHNCEILTSKQGNLLLMKRPAEEENKLFSYDDYSPCPECLVSC